MNFRPRYLNYLPIIASGDGDEHLPVSVHYLTDRPSETCCLGFNERGLKDMLWRRGLMINQRSKAST